VEEEGGEESEVVNKPTWNSLAWNSLSWFDQLMQRFLSEVEVELLTLRQQRVRDYGELQVRIFQRHNVILDLLKLAYGYR
jgi:hypothetical protein